MYTYVIYSTNSNFRDSFPLAQTHVNHISRSKERNMGQKLQVKTNDSNNALNPPKIPVIKVCKYIMQIRVLIVQHA